MPKSAMASTEGLSIRYEKVEPKFCIFPPPLQYLCAFSSSIPPHAMQLSVPCTRILCGPPSVIPQFYCGFLPLPRILSEPCFNNPPFAFLATSELVISRKRLFFIKGEERIRRGKVKILINRLQNCSRSFCKQLAYNQSFTNKFCNCSSAELKLHIN